MNTSPTATEDLHDCIVLVRQTAPPYPGTDVAMRGLLQVGHSPGERFPRVTIALSFPSGFTSAPEEITLTLSPEDVDALLASENRGTYEHVHRGALDDLRTRLPVAKVIQPRA